MFLKLLNKILIFLLSIENNIPQNKKEEYLNLVDQLKSEVYDND